jgi:hypothetical protein
MAAAFEQYVDKATRRDGVRVFVATDNADTQARFFDRYGEGTCLVHKRITQSGSLRQTTLKEAVVDLFVVSCHAHRAHPATLCPSFTRRR